MLRFIVFAVLVSGAPAVLFVAFRHQVGRWPLPGLWWLALGTLCLVLTLALAKHWL